MLNFPILYILMRNDLDSLNPGKAMAQASHATNLFLEDYEEFCQTRNALSEVSGFDMNIIKGVNEWERSTPQGFGTVIVLENDIYSIENVINNFMMYGYLCGIVHDPTYPLKDGSFVHHIPLNTCAYVFVYDKHGDEESKELLSEFPLCK